MKSANPYLNFNGNTEEAFEFYKSVFGGEFLGLVRFRDFGATEGAGQMPEDVLDKIGHISLSLGGNILMGTDALESMGHPLTVGNNLYISLDADSAEEAERLFNGLSAGGEVEMALQRTEWAERYGSLTDKFGVRWMVNYTGSAEFLGDQEG